MAVDGPASTSFGTVGVSPEDAQQEPSASPVRAVLDVCQKVQATCAECGMLPACEGNTTARHSCMLTV